MQFLGRHSIVAEDQERHTPSLLYQFLHCVVAMSLRCAFSGLSLCRPLPPYGWGKSVPLGLRQLSAHPNINTQSDGF
jgi:hypothetical protein